MAISLKQKKHFNKPSQYIIFLPDPHIQLAILYSEQNDIENDIIKAHDAMNFNSDNQKLHILLENLLVRRGSKTKQSS